MGGIVSAVDPATGAITIMSGAKKIVVNTTGKTVFRRFVGDSVKYEDAKPGTWRRSRRRTSCRRAGRSRPTARQIEAEEVVSGSFKNLSGLIQHCAGGIDMATGKITLKDLATKKVMTVNVTEKCDIRNVPLMMATRIAAQTNGGGQGGGRGGRGGGAGTAYGAGGGADKVQGKGMRLAERGAPLERASRR